MNELDELDSALSGRSGPALAPFQVFFDGDCPLCSKEIDWIKRKIDSGNNQSMIAFVDIAESHFAASEWGRTQEELMAKLHGRQADGTWVVGVEVFRRMYAAAGYRLPVALSRLIGIRSGLGIAYWLFAKYRTRLTGRCKATCSSGGASTCVAPDHSNSSVDTQAPKSRHT